MMPTKKTDVIVDLGSAYSFPASDPPSYMASTAVPGKPGDIGYCAPKQARGNEEVRKKLEEELQGTIDDTVNYTASDGVRVIDPDLSSD
jgi:hypothetical protein